jgi:hypothetical protein
VTVAFFSGSAKFWRFLHIFPLVWAILTTFGRLFPYLAIIYYFGLFLYFDDFFLFISKISIFLAKIDVLFSAQMVVHILSQNRQFFQQKNISWSQSYDFRI